MKALPLERAGFALVAAVTLSGCAFEQARDVTGQSQAAMPALVKPATSNYKILYTFPQHTRASRLIDVNGVLYGTTDNGGRSDRGTVYSITASGSEKVVYSFSGGSDGANPAAPLLDVNGTLYGTTQRGGASGEGTVFSVSPSGAEHVLHSFGEGSDGKAPEGGLINVDGTLYGATDEGGSYSSRCDGLGCGTVFSLTTSGTEKVLHAFGGPPDDGAYPAQSGVTDLDGTLYGTTAYGGERGLGTVYSLSTSGKERLLYSFTNSNGDEWSPNGGLIAVKGVLYGTMLLRGVFSITVNGKFAMVSRNFSLGQESKSGVIYENGVFYGTTKYGGEYANCAGLGCGVVFSMTKSGSVQTLYAFGGGSDGAYPSGLIDVNGTLYGTTAGYNNKRSKKRANATVYALTP